MKKLLKIIFITITTLILCAIIGGYIFIKNFNLNNYKQTIEKITYDYTGRTLKINGNAHLGISLIPTLVIDDISLSNASWSDQPNMIKLDKLQIEISVLPLLRQEIVINDLTLIKPQIYLEKSSSGMVNWNFVPQNKLSSTSETIGFAQLETIASPKKTSTSPLPEEIKNISIKNINIENGFLQYFDAQKQTTQNIELKSLTFSMDNLSSPINAEVDAIYQNEPISAKLKLGSLTDFLANDKPYNIDINANAYNIKSNIKGTAQNILKNISYNLNAEIYNPSGNFNIPEIKLNADISGNLQQINSNIKNLTVANNQITGTINTNLSKPIPQIKANLSSPLFDMRTLQNKSKTSYLNLISTVQASELVPNTAIPYSELKTINGSVLLDVKQLIINDAITTNNVNLNAVLNNGVLTISPLELNFGSGKIDMNAVLNANNQSLSLKVNSKDILLQDLHKEFIITQKGDFGIIDGGKTTIFIDLKSNGSTYRQLVQNAKGQFTFIVSESNIQTGALHFLTDSFVEQLIGVLKIDTQKSSNVNLRCAVINSNIANNKANFPQSIALQSNKITLSSTGSINLINDKIDFSIAPTFNFETGVMQTLSSLIKIEGTIQQPKIRLDDEQALKTIVGIATTGATAYIGSQLLSDGSPCYTALAGTSFQNLVPQPTTTQKATNGTSQAIKDTTDAIKNEFKNIEQNAKDFFNLLKGK